MKRVKDFFERGTILPLALSASAIVGFFTVLGLLIIPTITEPAASMRIEPRSGVANVGDTFTVEVVVHSSIPVNVFGGEVLFDKDILHVESIDYNTSIADLWAELPWYSNGDGTLNFGGGTTRRGGFFGTDTLLTITFKTLQEGSGTLTVRDARVIKYDGLGNDAPLEEPVDAIFTVKNPGGAENILGKSDAGSSYHVVSDLPSTDLNNDGKQSITDVSIFMLKMAGNNTRYDFNGDGDVNTKDLSILLNAN